MKKLPRFISKLIPNFEVTDVKEWISKGHIDIYFKKSQEHPKCTCSRCGTELKESHGKYSMKIQTMPIFNFKTYIHIWREKRFCPNCKKVRAEALEFISEETPHLTREYAWWLGRLCEISPVSRAAEFTGNDPMTMWRLDFSRMKRQFQHYKIPDIKRISVDEVYARKRKYFAKESRDKRFFTIISDLDTRRVVWVSESRDKGKSSTLPF